MRVVRVQKAFKEYFKIIIILQEKKNRYRVTKKRNSPRIKLWGTRGSEGRTLRMR